MVVGRVIQFVFGVAACFGFAAFIIGLKEPADLSLAISGVCIMGTGGMFVMFSSVILGRRRSFATL